MDAFVLNMALKTLKTPEMWKEYATFEKVVLLMPLMHAENGKYTRMCITEAMKLDHEIESRNLKLYNSGVGKVLQTLIKHAQNRDAAIQRFGRYPSRNEVLGRASTPEELEYIKSKDDF